MDGPRLPNCRYSNLRDPANYFAHTSSPKGNHHFVALWSNLLFVSELNQAVQDGIVINFDCFEYTDAVAIWRSF